MAFDEGEPVMDEDMTSAVAHLMERMLQQECEEMDGPHVLICRAVGTDVVSFQGPYSTGLAALAAADSEARGGGNDGQRLEFSVAPLLARSEPQE